MDLWRQYGDFPKVKKLTYSLLKVKGFFPVNVFILALKSREVMEVESGAKCGATHDKCPNSGAYNRIKTAAHFELTWQPVDSNTNGSARKAS
jgi:hypothetical protein